MFYVYQLRVEDEPLPFYVGKGKDTRAWDHLMPYNHRGNTIKDRKIRKVLSEGKQILVEFLETNINEDDAFTFEVFYISLYGRRKLGNGPLTNLTEGGEGSSGHEVTQEHRAKLSLVHKGKKLSLDHIEAIREYASKPKPEEQRRKMSESAKKMPRVTCPHCGKTGGKCGMVKYHFDNCKDKI